VNIGHNIPPSEQWYHAAQKWADLNAAADMLEEGKSAFLSQKMIRLGDMPVSRAELTVKASPEWADYIKKSVRAREQANLAKIEAEFLKMRFSEHMSIDANQRQEMRMVRT
jgi:hypothetical protein